MATKMGTDNINTYKTWARMKFDWMKLRVKNADSYKKKGIEIKVSVDDFIDWVKPQWPKIQAMKKNGYVPSIDRINSNGHYELENMRIISMAENVSRRDYYKAIKGTNLTTGEEIIFCPIGDIEKTEFTKSKVYAVLRGEHAQHKGYFWEYVDALKE